MPIIPLAGSPMWEEALRRKMLNQAGPTPAPQGSTAAGQGPITNPTYQAFRELEQNTGTNYGFIDRMMQQNPQVANMFAGKGASGYSASSSTSAPGYSAGGGPGGSLSDALLAAINASFDRSRLAHLGTGRAYEKRNQENINERMDGAQTGLLNSANKDSRKAIEAMLGQNEEQRGAAIAGAQERAEDRAMRHQDIQSRDRMTNSAAYSQGASYSSKNGRGGAGGGGGGDGDYDQPGYSSKRGAQLGMQYTFDPTTGGYVPAFNAGVDSSHNGQWTKKDWYASQQGPMGAKFAQTVKLPGGGGGGGSTAPPPGAPPAPGQNNQPGGGGGPGPWNPNEADFMNNPIPGGGGGAGAAGGGGASGGWMPNSGDAWGPNGARGSSWGGNTTPPGGYNATTQRNQNRQLNGALSPADTYRVGQPAGPFAPNVFNTTATGKYIASRPAGGGGGGYSAGGFR